MDFRTEKQAKRMDEMQEAENKKKELDKFFREHLIKLKPEPDLEMEMLSSVEIPETDECFVVPAIHQSHKHTKHLVGTPTKYLKNILFHKETCKIMPSSLENESTKPIKIRSFPGVLHIQLLALEYFKSPRQTDSFSLRIEFASRVYNTPHYARGQPVKINFYFSVPVNEEGVELKITLIRHRISKIFGSRTLHPVCKMNLKFNQADLENCRNRLKEEEASWYSWAPWSVFEYLKNLWCRKSLSAGLLQFTATYLANDEVPTVSSAAPTNSKELQRWLMVRHHADKLLYSGYILMRDKNRDWLHCYIKWYGYTIYVFLADTYCNIEVINIAGARPACNYKENAFKLSGDSGTYDFYCDTTERYYECLDAITILFGNPKYIGIMPP